MADSDISNDYERFTPHNDYSTLFGITLAIGIVGASVSIGGRILSFFDPASLLMVLGGTFSVTLACFTWKEIIDLRRSLKAVVFTKINDPKAVGQQVVHIADYAKKKGLLGLQNKEQEIEKSGLFQKGIKMLVDGNSVQEADQVIRQDIESVLHRNRRSATILRRASEIAPAMGLIGTLIGLVQMLGELNNPSNIGPYMALALLTTLYGALLSYMILTPLASKIERNSEEELLINKIYLISIISIGNQESPRKLERMINTILPPAKRLKALKE